MAHLIDADKLKAEFERRIRILREDDVVRQNCLSAFLEGKIYGYEELLSFIDNLQKQEQNGTDRKD